MKARTLILFTLASAGAVEGDPVELSGALQPGDLVVKH